MHRDDPKLIFIGIISPRASIWCMENEFSVHLIFWWFWTFSCTNSPTMHQNDPKLVFIRISSPKASSWCIVSRFLMHLHFKWFCTFSCTNSPPYKFVIRGNREYRCTKFYVKGLCVNQRMWLVDAEALFALKVTWIVLRNFRFGIHFGWTWIQNGNFKVKNASVKFSNFRSRPMSSDREMSEACGKLER